MSEESTVYMQREHPFALAVINVVAKRLELILTNIITAGVVLYLQHGIVHKQIWQETGQHFQDLVQTNNLLSQEINFNTTNNNSTK